MFLILSYKNKIIILSLEYQLEQDTNQNPIIKDENKRHLFQWK
jgi:hypothetical protein